MSQTARKIVMVKPHRFYSNPQTAGSNSFQSGSKIDVTDKVHAEFNAMVAKLQEQSVDVNVYDGPEGSPDAIFPNNTFSTHISNEGTGIFVSYPMEAENRQKELAEKTGSGLLEDIRQHYDIILDLRTWHAKNVFLEGTGSLVLDRENHIAYALISSRTNLKLAKEWSNALNYELFPFDAHDENGEPIYHTNVFMSVGTSYAVIATETIPDEKQQIALKNKLTATGKEIIEITRDQMNSLCGNIIEIENTKGEHLILMSQRAFDAFEEEQLITLEKHCDKIVPLSIPTIEEVGGGGVRCMVAEIFMKPDPTPNLG